MLAIIGAGGHTRSSLNLLKGRFNELAIFDQSFDPSQQEVINGVRVQGRIDDIPMDCSIFLSIGDNTRREQYFLQFGGRIIKENMAHASSLVEDHVRLGMANQIFAKSYINCGASIGDNNIINTACAVEHEVTIGNHNHLAVGSTVCGRVSIGDRCFIGAGSIIIDNISIVDDVTIGAGSIVTKSLLEPGVYAGIPARAIK